MRDSKSQGPLQEPTFLILLSLSSGEKHGYAILKDVESLSDGRVRLSTGTLYGALNRLLDQGLIVRGGTANGGATNGGAANGSAANAQVDSEDARGKKTYRLARAGRQVFDAEVSRMQRLIAAAQGAAARSAAAQGIGTP
jgi:DNA-binding PadR family transcriptional regulator